MTDQITPTPSPRPLRPQFARGDISFHLGATDAHPKGEEVLRFSGDGHVFVHGVKVAWQDPLIAETAMRFMWGMCPGYRPRGSDVANRINDLLALFPGGLSLPGRESPEGHAAVCLAISKITDMLALLAEARDALTAPTEDQDQ